MLYLNYSSRVYLLLEPVCIYLQLRCLSNKKFCATLFLQIKWQATACTTILPQSVDSFNEARF